MFQIKDFTSIVASEINHATQTQDKLTDFRVGSVARTLIEAPAIEIEELYIQMLNGILDAIPTSIYRAFHLELLDAVTAGGTVHILFPGVINDPFVIEAGTQFEAANGARYLAAADVSVPAGAISASVFVLCSETGVAGNQGAGEITKTSSSVIPGGATITSDPILSGRDAETEDERKARFVAYIQSIARGTRASCEYAASQAQVAGLNGEIIERVVMTGSIEVPGTLDVYIYGSHGSPSSDLLSASQRLIDGYYNKELMRYVSGYRPAGVRVRAMPMAEQYVDMRFTIVPLDGWSASSAMTNGVVTACTVVVHSTRPGETLFVEDVTEAVLAVNGVRLVRVNLSENITCPQMVALRAGAISVEYADA